MPFKPVDISHGTSLGLVAAPIFGPESKGEPQRTPPTIDPSTTVSSGKSVAVYHSTLFRAFNLSATSTYNYYIEGEENGPTVDSSGTLASLPRYVTLRWRVAPTPLSRNQPQKGVRPFITPEIVRFPTAASLEVASSALANGYVGPGVLTALIVDPPAPTLKTPTKIDEDSFLLSKTTAGKFAAAEMGVKGSSFAVIQPSLAPLPATVVNFVDPSIAGTFDVNRLQVATDPLHLTVQASLAKVMGALEVISEFNQDVPIQNPPPDFTGHPDVPTVMYLGYIIERHDMLPDGSMELGRVIKIDDPTVDEFVDQQVAYGGTYVYRMRSIVQWTRETNLDFAGLSTIDRTTAFSSRILPPMASFYAGDWCDWSRTQVLDTVPPEPPDEVTVRPVSWKGEVRISWRIGNDPQRDLTSFRLMRAVSTAGRVSEWRELGMFPVVNGSFVDRDVRPYREGNVSYIYALYATSFHGVDSPLSDQVEAKLSPLGKKDELPVVQVSVKGADRTEHPSGKQDPNPTEIKANRRLTFYCRNTRSGHPLRDSIYFIEVRSLATGERALVALDVDATDIGVADA
jgi:hypothetical protein